MSSLTAETIKQQSLHENKIVGNKDEVNRLNTKLTIQEKINARKRQKAESSSDNPQISKIDQINQLRERAEQEGKLIHIHRETDKVEHKLSLEEKLRNRKKLKSSKGKRFSSFFKGKIEKSDVYKGENTNLFQDLEEAAIEYVTKNIIPESWDELLKEKFCIEKLTDLEKARVIFHYITAQNLKKLKIVEKVDQKYDINVPLEALSGIYYGQLHYSTLYSHLVNLAGTKCKIVQGKVKGADWDAISNDFTNSDNTWNIVTINGQKQIVDPHWGSRHISNLTNEEHQYSYEEFYFLPKPEQLIYTHLPNTEKYQLISPPINMDTFKSRVKVWPLFWKLGLQLDSHTSGKIETEDGSVCISLIMDKNYEAFTQLLHNLKYDGELYNQHIMQYQEINSSIKQVFKLSLPFAGHYKLEICAHCPIFSKGPTFDSICVYDIVAKNINQKLIRPLWTQFDLLKQYGSSNEIKRHNLVVDGDNLNNFADKHILKGNIGDEFQLIFKIDNEIDNLGNRLERNFSNRIYNKIGTNDVDEDFGKFVKIVKKFDGNSVIWNVKLNNLLVKGGLDYACLVLYTNEPIYDVTGKISYSKSKMTVFAHYLLELNPSQTLSQTITPYISPKLGIFKPNLITFCSLEEYNILPQGEYLKNFKIKIKTDGQINFQLKFGSNYKFRSVFTVKNELEYDVYVMFAESGSYLLELFINEEFTGCIELVTSDIPEFAKNFNFIIPETKNIENVINCNSLSTFKSTKVVKFDLNPDFRQKCSVDFKKMNSKGQIEQISNSIFIQPDEILINFSQSGVWLLTFKNIITDEKMQECIFIIESTNEALEIFPKQSPQFIKNGLKLESDKTGQLLPNVEHNFEITHDKHVEIERMTLLSQGLNINKVNSFIKNEDDRIKWSLNVNILEGVNKVRIIGENSSGSSKMVLLV